MSWAPGACRRHGDGDRGGEGFVLESVRRRCVPAPGYESEPGKEWGNPSMDTLITKDPELPRPARLARA